MSRKNNASNDKSKADPSFIPEWHKQQELILKRWSEIGSSYRYLHDKAFHKFNRQNLWFALPVIVISTITSPYPEYTDKNCKIKKQRFSCKHDCHYCPKEVDEKGREINPRSYLSS